MFASFLLPSVFEGVEARHLLVFYKQLADFGRDHVAFVGEPAYFRAPHELKAEGRPEWHATWRTAYDYEPPASLDGVDYRQLRPDLLVPRLARLGSSWKLYGQMVTRRLPELEAAFSSALDHLCARHRIEAAIAFANLPSLSHVARLKGLPVIHAEFGPLRKPAYAMTGYWDLKGVSRRTDATRRYRRFRRELVRHPLALLDRDQLLETVRRTPMPQIVPPAEATYRVGLALQGEENAHVHGVSALDCLSLARRHFERQDILVRYHAGGLARYSDTLGVADVSSDATEFILKSEQIITVNSGVALEALLLDRRCIVLGDSPFSIASDRSFDVITRRDPDEQRAALNFLVLGYLVPGALMFDADYTRWRLSNPPEVDIFRYHHDWYARELAASLSAGETAAPAADPIRIQPVEPGRGTTVESDAAPAQGDARVTPVVLMVYPYCLDQVGHGNIQRVLSMARHIAASGFLVDLVYQANPRVAPVDAQYAAFRRVYRVEGGASSSDDEACARRLAAFYSAHEPPAAHLRPSAPLTTLVRALVEAEPYQAVVATYAWMAPAFAGLARRVPLVCDVQDILHEHAEACRRTTGHSSSFSLPAATEAFLWRQWDALIAITPEDMARIRRDLLPQQRLLSARHAAPEIAEGASAGDDDVALYAASDNMSNVQALQWLLEQVWPHVVDARPQARLQVAGLICRALPASAERLPGVDILGFRTDLREDVARAGVIVAPYLYGSGLKIKVVEAACAGKAIVTTRAGVAGTGLECRDAVAVENDPVAFAAALVRLLGDGDRRRAVATATLEQARRLYSPAACYGPVVGALTHLSAAARSAAPAFQPAALRRVRTVVEHLRPARVVLWGNGAHTRGMVSALEAEGIAVGLIVDGRATTAATSPEGIPVIPGTGFGVIHGDLVILSSETFENDMWHALTAYRAAGGWVLGLWDERRISRAILDRLSPGARAELGAAALDPRTTDSPAAVVLWDSAATPSRWWRTGQLQQLALAAHERGVPVVIAGPSTALERRPGSDWPETATLMPVLELDSRSIEAVDDPGEASDLLTRLASVTARATARAFDGLNLGRDDLLVLMSPSLTECFGVARALAASKQPGPSIVVHGVAPLVDGPHWSNLSEPDRRTYWRLAMSELAEAAGGRLHLVGSGSTAAAALRQFLDRPVSIVETSPILEAPAQDGRPGHTTRVLCLGHVCANIRPLLEALVGDAAARSSLGSVSCAWRSSGHGTGPVLADRWASGLATMLGIELLDDRTPSEMLAAIAGADVVVLADSAHDQWAAVVGNDAAAAGVPVVASANGLAARAIAAGAIRGDTFSAGNPTELLAALDRVLTSRRRRTLSTSASQDPALGTPASLFDHFLDASGFRRAHSQKQVASLSASAPSLTTEIAHAATY